MPTPVTLYLVRHAIAADRGPAYPDDALRPLTREGKQLFTRAARGLAELGVHVDEVLTSPLTRARQTAQILASALAGTPPVTDLPSLVPDSEPADVVADLERFSRRSSLALVGHEPSISALASALIGARGGIPFKKGAVCRIDVPFLPPARPGELVWFATPRMLRRLGGAKKGGRRAPRRQ
jgi:phosphohistidine phosphatase